MVPSCLPKEREYVYHRPFCLKKVEDGSVADHYLDSTVIGNSIVYYGSANCPSCVLAQMGRDGKEPALENRSLVVLYARGQEFENAIHIASLKHLSIPVYLDSTGIFEKASHFRIGAEYIQIVGK